MAFRLGLGVGIGVRAPLGFGFCSLGALVGHYPRLLLRAYSLPQEGRKQPVGFMWMPLRSVFIVASIFLMGVLVRYPGLSRRQGTTVPVLRDSSNEP